LRSLAARTADARGGALRSHAFGLDLMAAFEAPGLPSGPPSTRLPAVRLELASRADIDGRWHPAAPERLLDEELGGGTPSRTIDHDEALGYRLSARHFGLALISPEGDRVLCAPPGVAAWRWQRFLVERVLPWAAVLRGREVFHASAVQVGGQAIAFAGAAGFGKTSLALRMVMRGAGFVTDDALAIECARRSVPVAHPGASILALRPAERALLARGELRRVGTVLGSSGKTYVALERERQPLPLGAVYLLTPGRGTRIEPCPPDPRMLLESSFVASVATPDRVARVLDGCAAVSRDVPLFRALVDPDAGAAALAAAVHEHALAATEVAA
jgi:hypothetical protein